MATPVVQIIATAFPTSVINYLANDGFETDTAGWSVAAGIQAAATSITRTVAAPYMGVAVGRLVTTATNGSGVKFVLGNVVADLPLRFRVFLKSVSGTTAAKLTIGSLGTPADRASATFTLTTSWAEYAVTWTPSADRADTEVNITNNAASIMTADIDDAEVYETSVDVTSNASDLVITRGLNFEGGLTSGSATFTLKNDTLVYSVGSNRLRPGGHCYIRATYAGVPYGLFYGRISRVSLQAESRTVVVFATEISAYWSDQAEVNIVASNTRSLSAFRGLILDAMGVTATQRNLATGEAEADMPLTGADQADPLSVLASIDASTLTLSYLVHSPSPSVLYVYTTLPRMARSIAASAETVGDVFTGMDLSVDDITNFTAQRVNLTGRTFASSTLVWTADEVPITVAAGETRTIWATLSAPTLNAVLSSSGTVSPVMTAFSQSAKLVITGPGTVTAMSITGTAAVAQSGKSVLYDIGSIAPRTASPLDLEFVPSQAAALGVAQFLVTQSQGYDGDGLPRGDLTMVNRFPTQLVRNIGDKVEVDPAVVVDMGPNGVTIEAVTTTVDMGAAQWMTTWRIGAPGVAGDYFLLGTSSLGGTDVLGI